MGAGKTTLIKALGKNLGVKDPITSPTFSLVNQYKAQSGETIYHFDWYRIEDEEEAEAIGFYEYVDSQAYCFMEWPEKISTLIPDDYTKVEISINSDGSRHFSVMNQSHE
jgi:tRNA threonylcarbamoyladenosine biosynthesis protein TsaE